MKLLKGKENDDLGSEKHVPVVTTCCNKVTVKIGKTPHPNAKDHYIQWIMLVTNKGMYVKYLNPEDDPQAFFTLCKKEEPLEVYSYCNIHSLYKTVIKKGDR